MLIRAIRSILRAFMPSGVDIQKMHKLYCSFEQTDASLSSKQVLCEVWGQRVVSDGRNVQVHVYTPVKQKGRKILLFSGIRIKSQTECCSQAANIFIYLFF